MTIHEVKRIHEEKHPESYFFSRDAMRFFHQTLRDFSVTRLPGGLYMVQAPMYQIGGDGRKRKMGETRRVFNPETGELETYND